MVVGSRSAGSVVDDVGNEGGLESAMTVLGVCCRKGGTGFGGCVEFDSVVFSGVLLSVRKIWVLVLDFLLKLLVLK